MHGSRRPRPDHRVTARRGLASAAPGNDTGPDGGAATAARTSGPDQRPRSGATTATETLESHAAPRRSAHARDAAEAHRPGARPPSERSLTSPRALMTPCQEDRCPRAGRAARNRPCARRPAARPARRPVRYVATRPRESSKPGRRLPTVCGAAARDPTLIRADPRGAFTNGRDRVTLALAPAPGLEKARQILQRSALRDEGADGRPGGQRRERGAGIVERVMEGADQGELAVVEPRGVETNARPRCASAEKQHLSPRRTSSASRSRPCSAPCRSPRRRRPPAGAPARDPRTARRSAAPGARAPGAGWPSRRRGRAATPRRPQEPERARAVDEHQADGAQRRSSRGRPRPPDREGRDFVAEALKNPIRSRQRPRGNPDVFGEAGPASGPRVPSRAEVGAARHAVRARGPQAPRCPARHGPPRSSRTPSPISATRRRARGPSSRAGRCAHGRARAA